MAEPNPFQSPESAGPAERPRLVSMAQTRSVKSTQFSLLGIQFTGLGALILLVALAVSLRSWWGLIGVAAGVGFIVAGQGLFRYKLWGWHCAAILIVPLLLLMVVLTVLLGLISGWLFFAIGMVLVLGYSFYTLHALFSRAGRQRYADTAQAKLATRRKSREPRQAERLDL